MSAHPAKFLLWLWHAARIIFVAALVFWTLTIVAGFFAPPISTLMWGRHMTFQTVNRQYVPLNRISPQVPAAVIMSEDGQFCRHHGVDWQALTVVIDRVRGPNRGASTLAMQVAKNMLLWPGRSYIRKAMEIPLAVILDALWGKKRLLEIYLNIAEWGDGIFGIEAAAKAYFGKPALALSARESAFLAAALPNPLLRNPGRPGRRQLMLASIIQSRMAGAGAWLECLR